MKPLSFWFQDSILRVKVPKLKYYRLEQLYDTIVVACVPR
jgi:hypothetical protein